MNVTSWTKALQLGKPQTSLAFDYGITGTNPVSVGESNMQYQSAFDIEKASEPEYL